MLCVERIYAHLILYNLRTYQKRHIISSFFLILFISVKLIGLHSLTHDENENKEETCLVCDHFLVDNLSPVTPSVTDDFDLKPFFFYSETLQDEYVSVELNTSYSRYFFSRPPPVV